MPRFLDLTPTRATEIGRDIVDGWEADNEDRKDWLDALPQWLEAYQGRPVPKHEPWQDASNLRVPVTEVVVDTLHPREMAAKFKPDPMVGFRAQEPSDYERCRKRERFLDWACREEVNLFPIVDRGDLMKLINGLQFYKASWCLETRRLKDKHVFGPAMPVEEAVERVLAGEDKFIEALTRVNDVDVEVVLKGRKGTVTFEVETKPDALIVYSDREEVVKDQPIVELVRAEDIVVPSDSTYDLQSVDHIYHRYWLKPSQIKARARTGTFRELSKDDEATLERLADGITDSGDSTAEVKRVGESITGADVLDRIGGPDRVELIDAYFRDDLDDDGQDEEWLVTVAKESPGLILRAVRLEDVYRHGMRPFSVSYHAPVGDSFWAMGVPQMLEGLQQEFNVIHNQRCDAGSIAITPFGFYRPGAGMKPQAIRIEPGVLHPMDDPRDDVNMIQVSPNLAWSSAEEGNLWALVEKRTKVSDLMLGRVSEHQGAARTAAGVSALTTQGAAGLEIYLRRDQEWMKSLLRQILALYAQYMPPGKEKRILGYNGEPEMVVTREDLTGSRDMIFTGNALSTDREIERNTVTFLAQSALNPGVFQFLLQLGVMTPQSIAEWYRYLFQVFDVPRLDKLVVIPPADPVKTPEEIVNRTVQGELLPPKPGENHQRVLEMLTQIRNGSDAVSLAPTILAVVDQQLQVRQGALQQEQQIQQLLQQAQAMQQFAALQGAPGFGGAPQAPAPPPQGLAY